MAFCLHKLPSPEYVLSAMVAVHNIVVNVWCVVDVTIWRLLVGHRHTEMDQRFRPPHHVVTETGDRADNRTETGDPTDNRIGSMYSTIFTPSYIFDGVD